jgi:hypothetical protein
MNIVEKIRDYQNNLTDGKEQSSIFLDLVDDVIKDFPYRLKNKTYLLIPDPKKELTEVVYEYYLSKGETIPIALTLKISQIINKFNEVAQKLGFTIITKMSEYRNDGQLFDLLGIESVNKGLIEEEYINFSNVKVPVTLSVDDFIKNISFPRVFKNITANRGEDKYLIENEEQLKKIMALFELPESKKINLKNEFVVQEYIKSFDDINSSIRVFTTCTGDILSSLFLFSTDKNPKNRIKKYGFDIFNPCEYLNDPTSPCYLNSKNIISNAAAGGKAIPLNIETSKLDATDEIVLTLHGINIETLELPEKIIEQCKEISTAWESKKGIVLGIDFIYNSKNDNWYYLETNRNPSVDGYKYFMNLNGYLKKDIKAFMHLHALTKIVENIMSKDIIEEKSRTK